MQQLEPEDRSLVSNFACKVPQTISITPVEQTGRLPGNHYVSHERASYNSIAVSCIEVGDVEVAVVGDVDVAEAEDEAIR